MMFGKKSSEIELPAPPNAEEILEDLSKAGPDDIVFTTEISCDLDPLPRTYNLTKRFQVRRVHFREINETFIIYQSCATRLVNDYINAIFVHPLTSI